MGYYTILKGMASVICGGVMISAKEETATEKAVVTNAAWSAQVISWESAAERIGELLESGPFASNVELAEAAGYERSLLSEKLWHLYHDLSAVSYTHLPDKHLCRVPAGPFSLRK